MARGSSSRQGTLRISVTGDDRDLDRKLDGVNRKLAAFGAAAAVAVAAFTGAAVKSYAEFDEAMTSSLAIMGDVSDAMRGEMSDAAREVARTTVFSATQSAESYFFLASAGLDAEQSIAALPRVAAFAQAGLFDMATATDLLTDAQSALGLASTDAQENLLQMERVGDVLVRANTLANASVEEFATALTTRSAAAMRQMNIEVEEGVAVLATFADQGLKGSQAGTILARTIEGLAAQADQLQGLGVSVFDAAGEMRNMADIAEGLERALGDMTTEQRNAELAALGFNERTRLGVQLMLGNSDAVREYESELHNAGGTMDEIASNQLESLSAQWGLLRDRMTDVQLTIGERVAPALETVVGLGMSLFDAFEGLDPSMQTAIIGAAGLSAAALGLVGGFVALRAAAHALGVELLRVQARAGLIGAAFAALGFVIGSIVGQSQEARDSVHNLSQAYGQLSSDLDEHTRKAVFAELAELGLIESGRELGLTAAEVADAYLGNADALDHMQTKINEAREASEALTGPQLMQSEATLEAAQAAGDLEGMLERVNREVARSTAELEDLAEQSYTTAEAAEALGIEADQMHSDLRNVARGAMDAKGDGIDPLEGGFGDLEDQIGDTRTELQEWANDLRELTDPVFALRRADERLTDAKKALADATGDEVVPAMWDVLEAQSNLNTAAADAEDDIGLSTSAMFDLAEQAHLTEDQIRILDDELGDLRSTIGDVVDASPYQMEMEADIESAELRIARIREAAQRAAGTYTIRFRATGGPAQAFHAGGLVLHDGGLVGHDGAQMPLRPDEVPAILQTGELVLSRADVAALSETLRHLPRFHDGGWVTPTGATLATDSAHDPPPPPVPRPININVEGSVVSERDLVEVVRGVLRDEGKEL